MYYGLTEDFENITYKSPKDHNAYSVPWWWHHHALELLFFRQNWGFYQSGGNHRQLQRLIDFSAKPSGVYY